MEEIEYCKARVISEHIQVKGKEHKQKEWDYLDEVGTELEAIEPTQEIPRKTSQKKVVVMNKMKVSGYKLEIMDTEMTRLK